MARYQDFAQQFREQIGKQFPSAETGIESLRAGIQALRSGQLLRSLGPGTQIDNNVDADPQDSPDWLDGAGDGQGTEPD